MLAHGNNVNVVAGRVQRHEFDTLRLHLAPHLRRRLSRGARKGSHGQVWTDHVRDLANRRLQPSGPTRKLGQRLISNPPSGLENPPVTPRRPTLGATELNAELPPQFRGQRLDQRLIPIAGSFRGDRRAPIQLGCPPERIHRPKETNQADALRFHNEQSNLLSPAKRPDISRGARAASRLGAPSTTAPNAAIGRICRHLARVVSRPTQDEWNAGPSREGIQVGSAPTPRFALYSPVLAQAIGYVVLAASDAEDSIGELIVLRKDINGPDPTWWQSGEALVQALEEVGDDALQPIADEMRELLPLRHHVVHALWLEGPDGSGITLLRGRSTKKDPRDPGFAVGTGWSADSLHDLAERFLYVDRLADDAITRFMGI